MKRGEQAKLIRELVSEHGFEPGIKMAISKLVKAEDYRIHKTRGGLIKIPETVKALIDSGFGDHSKKVKETLNAKKGKSAIKAKSKKEKSTDSGDDSGVKTIDIEKYLVDGKLSLKAPRPVVELWKSIQSAEKDRIANEVKLKTLISLDEVCEKSFDLWRQVRESIQSIHDRCGIKIRATESDHEAEQILKEEENRILNSIVDGYSSLGDPDLKKKLLLRLTRTA